MAITNYSDLQTAIANVLNRDDMTARIPEWIALAEADMEMRLRLLEFETVSNITITSGSGALPAGFAGMRSVYWDDASDLPMHYITPEAYETQQIESGTPRSYTVTGSTIKVVPTATGAAVATYNARFTALSNSNATNAIITNFPNAYLYGSLLHGAIYLEDDAKVEKFGLLFNAIVEKINVYNEQRKYPGALSVRAR